MKSIKTENSEPGTKKTGKSCSICQDSSQCEVHEKETYNYSNKEKSDEHEDITAALSVESEATLQTLKQDESPKKQDGPVKCEDCGISFKSRGTMENHQKKCKCGNFISFSKEISVNSVENRLCDLCAFSTNNSELMEKHICKILPLLQCKKCPYASRLLPKMDLHNSFEHMAPLKCSQCDYISQNKPSNHHAAKYTMTKHMDKHYIGIFDCFECGDTFKVNQRLSYHIKAKHCSYICQECSKEESSAYKLKQHIKKMHNM